MAQIGKLKISVPVLVTVAVLAIALVAFELFQMLRPDPELARGEADNRFVTQMALKSGGDLSKLSPEEQAQLQKLTKGEAQKVLSLHPSSAIGRMMRTGAIPARGGAPTATGGPGGR